MIDTTTKKPIEVSSDGLIIVPVAQLDEVTALLDANNVPYWVDEEVLSIDDQPEDAFITLEHKADPAMVQRLLDKIP